MKSSLITLAILFMSTSPMVHAASNFHSYDTSAPSSDHANTRVNETVQKDEVLDTASTGQAATKRDYNREYDSKKTTSCKARSGQWLRPQDSGYIDCMNMTDTLKR